MHFSYVEIGDNFVPDIVTDQFRRVPVKFGITLNEGDDMSEAITTIKQAIKEYIEKNTVYHSPQFSTDYNPIEYSSPFVSKNLQSAVTIPSIQVEEEKPEVSLIHQMATCNDVEVLKSYRLLAKKDPSDNAYYHLKLQELQS